jgi:lysophospholipase L1-like esterase
MLTNSFAKRILCFGDSNTWGMRPDRDFERYTVDERWPALLQRAIGDKADIIEEGMCARTTDVDYAHNPGRNGKTYLLPCLESQNPIDAVIIMLGTNDAKTDFKRTPTEIAAGVESLISMVQDRARGNSGNARIFLVSPPPPNPAARDFVAKTADRYDAQAVQTLRDLAPTLKALAARQRVAFFDAATVSSMGDDGIHLDVQGHAALAQALASIIKEWL